MSYFSENKFSQKVIKNIQYIENEFIIHCYQPI